jgi:NTE family protein
MKIVLSGSGMLYPIHVGAIKRLLECGCIDEVCGTSGGAIIAAMIASGMDNYVDTVLDNLPAESKVLDPSFVNLRHYGLMSGKKIEDMFKKFYIPKFKDTKIPLKVITVDLNEKKHCIFGTKETPDFPIARAVRASMGIPGIFSPVSIGGNMHVDGGVVANFPLDIYGTGQDVVGVRIKPTIYRSNDILNIKDYISSIIGVMMDSLANHSIRAAVDARTITIPTTRSGLNFMLTKTEAEEMIEEGYSFVDKWLETHKVD